MHQFIAKAPALLVEVHIESKTIIQIDLKKKKEGFFVTFLGEKNSILEKSLGEWLLSYAQRKPAPLPDFLSLDGLPTFTRGVLSHLPAISFGQKKSYQDVARLLGNPKGSRAVGQACGRNPYLLCIPCHRVISSSQKLGGFSSGLEIKEILLNFES